MSSFSGEDKHLGNNIPLRQSEQEQQQLQLQQQKEEEQKLSPYVKRILVVDDDPDITLTFKKGLETENETSRARYSFKSPLIMILYWHWQNSK